MKLRIKLLVLVSLVSPLCAFAQNVEVDADDSLSIMSEDSVTVLGRRFHRSVVSPVPSAQAPSSNVIDTMATEVPGVNVILFNDNTWKYQKSDEYISANEVFSRYWNTDVTNPYQMPVDSLEEYWAVWMVDSLSEYHAPQTGNISSRFGYRHGRYHNGVDVPLPVGTPLYCVFDGKVRMSEYMKGYGNLIVIRHNNGLETFYGHMSRRDVNPGDIVHSGDVIGLSGNTGRSTGPHVHFEVRYNGLALDPQRIIDFQSGVMKQRIMVLKRRYFAPGSRYDQNFDDEFLNEEDDKKALEEQKKKEAEAAAKAIVYHKVRSGECLSSIARKYHTSVNAICRLNGIKSTTTLQIGRRLRVR